MVRVSFGLRMSPILLDSQFALVIDDGTTAENPTGNGGGSTVGSSGGSSGGGGGCSIVPGQKAYSMLVLLLGALLAMGYRGLRRRKG